MNTEGTEVRILSASCGCSMRLMHQSDTVQLVMTITSVAARML